MATNRRKSTKRRSSGKGSAFKPLIWFLLLILLLGGMALLASYYMAAKQDGKQLFSELWYSGSKIDRERAVEITPMDQGVQTKQKKAEPPEPTQSDSNPVQGHTWVSMLNGTMLTVEGNRYTIDFPSVEEQLPMKGSIAFSPNEFTLLNSSSDDLCNNIAGVYSYSFIGDELTIAVKSDLCSKRSRNLAASWFKL
jgi:hypothetical protein